MCVYAQTEASSCSCDYGRSYVYRVDRAPLCDYMVSFIHKLRSLPENYMMNSVLENFTVLQVHTVAVLAIKTSGGGGQCLLALTALLIIHEASHSESSALHGTRSSDNCRTLRSVTANKVL